jgi:hypothetical protein
MVSEFLDMQTNRSRWNEEAATEHQLNPPKHQPFHGE